MARASESALAMRPTHVVFDIGNVLLDWDPRHLYRRIFDDHDRMEWFLSTVCTPAWNIEQDRGRSFAQAVAELSAAHPDWADAIAAFDTRWVETVSGPIHGTVQILETLRAADVPTWAITNFSAEKFAVAREHWPFLNGFRDVVVSGEEKLLKPDPDIYRVLLDRNGLTAADCVFIDDSLPNVRAAAEIGMTALPFTGPEAFAADLARLGFPVPPAT